MSIQQNLIRLRGLSGLTQEQFAEVAGVSRAAVSLWEIGKSEPRMGAIQTLADHFGVRMGNIIEDGGMDGIGLRSDGSIGQVSGSDPLDDESFDEIAVLYVSMRKEGRDALLAAARGMAEAYKADEGASD